MLKYLLRIVASLIGALFIGTTASAQRIAELYSNGDGSMQFVMLETDPYRTTLWDGYPGFGQLVPATHMRGYTLVASNGTSEHRFAFPTDPNPWSGAWTCNSTDDWGEPICVTYPSILIATKSFGDLATAHGRPSDYTIPDGFLFPENGSVRLEEVGVVTNSAQYDVLPRDGFNALWWDSSLSPAQVRAAVAFEPFTNYTGLWWAAPAGSEPGWGINFSHQGDTIFGTWFTYDANGKPLWMPILVRGRDGAYKGGLYAHNGAPLDAIDVFESAAGLATAYLSFDSATAGTITYSVESGAHGFVTWVTKPIVLQSFGPVPTCVWGMQSDLSKATNYQGLWYGPPAESDKDWGVNLTQQGTTIFAIWFTHDANRDPVWLSAVATQIALGTFSGTLDRTTGPPFGTVPFGPVQHQSVGRATFSFSDGNAGTFAYDVDLGDGTPRSSQTKAITRQVFRAPGTVCN